MAFQTPVTIEEILAGIHRKEYLLPAIQREFVWNTDQIRRLVDSLMRGYPIGSFLLWKVEAETAKQFAFYDFLTDYHQRDKPYATKGTVPNGKGITAILDGQQRLTALNIAVYGSHAEKKKYAWWNSADAFPKKRLYLNLAAPPDHEELGLRYDLRFLTKKEAEAPSGQPDAWFLVRDVLDLPNAGPAMTGVLHARGLDLNDVASYQRLYDLYQAFRVMQPVNYYLEQSQDPNKVLDIFVRVNSGGTTLSYSDLLLSMATNQWKNLDAREEVRGLVLELNTGGNRDFGFSKDVVLKTALMNAGVDLRFQVSNFTQDNMAKVEGAWDGTRASLLRAATLLDHFGYSARTLTADSVIIPVAYYLARRGLGDSYLDSTADAADRLVLQRWVTRSLVKRGIWGSGLDSTLGRIRAAIDQHGGSSFPAAEIEAGMATLGKSLSFEPTEIDELLEMKYGGQRTFSVLSLLYPGLDLSKEFHEDHVFPRSRFSTKKLLAVQVTAEQVDDFKARFDLLPNLQLLGGGPNIEKRAKMPHEWLQKAFPTPEQRDRYIQENDLDNVPASITDFPAFFEQRKARMRQRLLTVLGVDESSAPVAPPPEALPAIGAGVWRQDEVEIIVNAAFELRLGAATKAGTLATLASLLPDRNSRSISAKLSNVSFVMHEVGLGVLPEVGELAHAHAALYPAVRRRAAELGLETTPATDSVTSTD